MRRMLLLLACFVLISSAAMADHIRVYSDASGASCILAGGFNFTSTILQKFSTGTTGSRFKVMFPAGSNFFAFNTPFNAVGFLPSDLALDYGQCRTGTVVLGTILANLSPGYVTVLPADNHTDIVSRDCDLVEQRASGGSACVDCPPLADPCSQVATKPSTWGSVKALYR